MEKQDFRRKSGDLEHCVQHEKGKWLKMDNGFTLLQSDCSESTLQTKGIPAQQQANQFYGLKLAFATSVVATNVAFAFAREKLALGSGWVVHGRLHSLLSPFAHGYFMGKIVCQVHSGRNLSKKRRNIHVKNFTKND